MKVLVTGSGFVASHLVDYFTNIGHKVDVVSRSPSTLHAHKLYSADITSFSAISRVLSNGYDLVIHTAAQSIVKNALKDPNSTVDINVMGMVNVLEAARRTEVGRLVHFSTDKIYGEGLHKTEEDPFLATGIYETSKASSDIIANGFIETYGMKVTIIRPANLVGFDPYNKRIVPNTIKKALAGESPIIYEETLGNESMREYLSVYDLCNAIEFLLNHNPGRYNIGSGEVRTQEEVVNEILAHFPGVSPKYAKQEKIPEIQKQSLSSLKIRSLGWEPNWNFKDMIELTVNEFKAKLCR